jgi:hypothetical protein
MRVLFKQKQKQVEPIVLVGTRYGVSPDGIRLFSVIGMVGIALLIVILTIMGYRLTPIHISYLLTLGIIVMTVQYYPLVLVGEKGIGSIDLSIYWKDLERVKIIRGPNNSRVHIEVYFRSGNAERSAKIFLSPDKVDAFSAMIKEYSSAAVE